MYYSRTLSPPSTVLMIAGAAVAMLGIASFLAYMLYGPQIAARTSSSCVYCPSSPVRVSLNGGLRGTLPGTAPLPEADPFRHTAIYYCMFNDMRPSGTASKPTSDSVIQRTDMYNLFVDSNTGQLGIQTLPDDGDQPVYMGRMPLQSFCQVTVVQEEKELRVLVNGIPRGSVMRKNLPPTSSIQSQYILNKDGVVRSGIVYQVQIHKGILTEEDLLSAYERMAIQYENDVTFQNTHSPTAAHQSQMSTTDTLMGYLRVLGSFFGYDSGMAISSNNTRIIQDMTRVSLGVSS